MFIIRKDLGKTVAFKTFEGWVECDKVEGVLDLQDVMRFTEREQELNQATLKSNENFVWFGSYK